MALRINADVEILADHPALGPGHGLIHGLVPGEAATVRVTARDIAKGKRCDCLKCPLALAMTRVWPDAAVVAVSYNEVYVYASAKDYDDGEEPDETWSHSAEDFIELFDDDKTVEPRDIRLRLVQRYS
jgi:hypothetical protein